MTFTNTRTKAYSGAHSKLVYSGRFADFKRLRTCVNLLEQGSVLPPSYKNHLLHGEYSGLFECHVGFDLLLVYKKDEGLQVITLIALGSHSDLFG